MCVSACMSSGAATNVTSKILRLDNSASNILNMLKFLISLSIGVYAGVYIAQNYEVPRVDEPSKIYQRILQFLEENKKK